MPLTARQVETAKPKEKPYKLSDGGGLYLFVTISGSRSWRLKFRFEGKEKLLTIGLYPAISLAEARDARELSKKELARGIDPSLKKQMAKNAIEKEQNFSSIFAEWFEKKKPVWSLNYSSELKAMFEDDILPIIGHYRLEQIEPLVLMNVIKRFEDRGAMSRAEKARTRCGEVFRFAIATGRAKYNPAPDLINALTGYRKENYPFLPMEQIHDFNRALNAYSGSVISKYAAVILQYTALRTVELRSMVWENIDFENRLITIDPSVMKGRRLHVVPMSDQVIEALKIIKPMTEMHKHVFIGRNDPKKPISDGTILGVIRRIGYQGRTCGHGFRHQFSTVCNEHKWHEDAIEIQLAHESGGGTRGIYNHAKHLSTRQEMMQWWADWIDGKNG